LPPVKRHFVHLTPPSLRIPNQSGQKRRLSKEPADPDEHILKAQEAAHRREFLQRQRQEREEWEKDVLQKERAAREQWEHDVLKDMDDWKVRGERKARCESRYGACCLALVRVALWEWLVEVWEWHVVALDRRLYDEDGMESNFQ
jgi:hypothetical protein